MSRQEDRAVVRQRFVTINFASLDTARVGGNVEINLFPDLTVNARIKDVRQTPDGSTIWTGEIPGDDMGQFFVVSRDEQIALDITTPGGLFQVRHSGGNLHAVQQIDQSAYPEEMPPIEISLPEDDQPAASSPNLDSPTGPQADGNIIDVLVAYTPASRAAAGSVTAIQNVINLAVAETNQSYINSGITQRINLVAMVETPYTETSDMGTDLARLQTVGDGFMDELHTLRNTYAADLVSLISEGKMYCGIAYHQSTITSSFASYAFSNIARDCATGYFSFAHELGHNMGARHDWYVDANVTPQTYAHGYVSVAGRWRTIMAYNNLCSANGVTCTRIQYWSNPAVTYNNQVTGIAGGTTSACAAGAKGNPACDADDHRTLNETVSTVANYRQRPVTGPTPTPRPPVLFWNAAHYTLLPIIRK